MKIRNIFSLFLLINVFVLAAEESVLTIQENGKNHGLPEIITFSEPVKTGYFLPIYTADTLKLKNGVNAFADSLVNEAGSFSGISAKILLKSAFVFKFHLPGNTGFGIGEKSLFRATGFIQKFLTEKEVPFRMQPEPPKPMFGNGAKVLLYI